MNGKFFILRMHSYTENKINITGNSSLIPNNIITNLISKLS